MQEKYYNSIKNLIIDNEVNKVVKNYSINKTDLETKYEIGKLLSEAGKHYGEGIIKNYSIRLTQEFGKGYKLSNLKNMRNYYIFQKSHPVVGFLTWSHILKLISLKNEDKINYYIKQIKNNNLSKRELEKRIKSKEYERLPIETKKKLIRNETIDIRESIPEPIIISIKDKEIINEKILHSYIIENIEKFMKLLGSGYSYIDSEYKIKIGNKYNYIDILLFNYIYNSFVVVELKITELKKDHLGQIQVYMNYVDNNLKNKNQNKTIGLLIVKKNNEYVLYSSDGNIILRTFKLLK